jgi:hypothetical protein
MSWPPETVEECSEYCESAYRAGDKHALIMMIGACAISGWLIPKWVGSIIEGADGYAVHGMLKSWDDVFGKPPTPKKGALLRNWQLRWHVLAEVVGAHAKGCPIDDLLFERIGREMKIGGKTKVKELYRLALDELERNRKRNENVG